MCVRFWVTRPAEVDDDEEEEADDEEEGEVDEE